MKLSIINIAIKKCKNCSLNGILDKDNLCETCNPIKINIIMLAKQNSLQKALESNDLKFISVDKMIDKGVCGKERPDFVFDMYKLILILECDEYQHKDRQISCETTRMKNIGQSYGGIPIYFIRWNPDNYKPGNNIKKKDLINTRQIVVCEYIKSIINDKITDIPACSNVFDDNYGVRLLIVVAPIKSNTKVKTPNIEILKIYSWVRDV